MNTVTPLVGRNFPSLDEKIITTGSTDVGDLSQLVPVSMLSTTCFSTGCPGHSWGNVAASGMSIGHKGMLHAAKIMAVAALDCCPRPDAPAKGRHQELEKVLQKHPYQNALLPHQKVPYYPNPERGIRQ